MQSKTYFLETSLCLVQSPDVCIISCAVFMCNTVSCNLVHCHDDDIDVILFVVWWCIRYRMYICVSSVFIRYSLWCYMYCLRSSFFPLQSDFDFNDEEEEEEEHDWRSCSISIFCGAINTKRVCLFLKKFQQHVYWRAFYQTTIRLEHDFGLEMIICQCIV